MTVLSWTGFVARKGALVGSLLIFFDHSTLAQPDAWLITPEEAALAPAPEEEIRSRGLTDAGPMIDVVKPTEGGEGQSPLEILIHFVPRSESVNLSSLRVSVIKLFSIDITDRVRPYATPEGIQLKEAKVPSGKHRVRISLSDHNGGTSVREISFEVR
jgi:hypothetical protein